MIDSIEIRNFQSHKKTKLKFHPGVTAIVGSSDSGKTAILRALNWVVNNKPSGDAFRSKTGGDTVVKVSLVGGNSVIRSKTDKANSYQLILSDKEETEELKAFGQNVPAEVNSIFRMDDENIQGQMDSPFLFSSNDGEVARRLNQAANLEKIDQSQSYISKKIRAASVEIKQVGTVLKDAEEELKATDFIESADNTLKELQEIEKDIRNKERLVSDLSYALVLFHDMEKSMDFSFLTGATQWYNVALKRWGYYISKKQECSTIEGNIQELIRVTKTLKDLPDTDKGDADLERLLSYSKGVDKKEGGVKELNSALIQLDNLVGEIKDKGHELGIWKTDYKKLMPKTCPFCGDLT